MTCHDSATPCFHFAKHFSKLPEMQVVFVIIKIANNLISSITSEVLCSPDLYDTVFTVINNIKHELNLPISHRVKKVSYLKVRYEGPFLLQ